MIEQNSPVPVVATISVPATASTTTIGAPFQSFGPSDKLVVFSLLNAMTGGTLDVYLQETWDGGQSWSDVAHFTQLAGGTGASNKRAVTGTPATANPLAIGVGTASTPNVTLAGGSFVDAPWGPLLRIVAVTGTGITGTAQAQTIKLIPWQQSH